MITVTDILQDINRGIMANNIVEDYFSYRIIFYVNDGTRGAKHYIDTSYSGLRVALESIVKDYLSPTNSVVVATITIRKSEETVSLLSRSYGFSLDGYFQQIVGEKACRSMYCGRKQANY